MRNDGEVVDSPQSRHVCFQVSANLLCSGSDIYRTEIIIILVLPPGVVCQSNCALPMPGTADGDVVSRCQVLGRAGSVHHEADQ